MGAVGKGGGGVLNVLGRGGKVTGRSICKCFKIRCRSRPPTSLVLPYVHIHKNKKFQLVHIFSSTQRHPLHHHAGLDRRQRSTSLPVWVLVL